MTMHQKENVFILLIYAQKGQFWKEEKIDHFLVFFYLHLLFPKKKFIEINL